MLVAVLGRVLADVEEQIGERFDLAVAARASWNRATDSRRAPAMRLFFAVYGRALQEASPFAAFLDHVVADFTEHLVEAQGSAVDPDVAEREATW